MKNILTTLAVCLTVACQAGSVATTDWVRKVLSDNGIKIYAANIVSNTTENTVSYKSVFKSEYLSEATYIKITLATTNTAGRTVSFPKPEPKIWHLLLPPAIAAYIDETTPAAVARITVEIGSGISDESGNEIILAYGPQDHRLELPEEPSEDHICKLDAECRCENAGLRLTDITYPADYDDYSEDFVIDFRNWIDLASCYKTEHKKKGTIYWLEPLGENGRNQYNTLNWNEIAESDAWKTAMRDLCRTANTWMKRCKIAYSLSALCDHDNPQHDWSDSRCGEHRWSVCRRNRAHRQGEEQHDWRHPQQFDGQHHTCACGRQLQKHIYTWSEREMKSGNTGWTKTGTCACGKLIKIDHDCKHQYCMPCNEGDEECALPCPTCNGEHDYARAANGKCSRCRCPDCGVVRTVTVMGAAHVSNHDHHRGFRACDDPEHRDPENERSNKGKHCICECGYNSCAAAPGRYDRTLKLWFGAAAESLHKRDKLDATRYEDCGTEDPKCHWVSDYSDCRNCGDKFGRKEEHTYDTEKPTAFRWVSNDKCAWQYECEMMCGKKHYDEEGKEHPHSPTEAGVKRKIENSESGESLCRWWYECKNCKREYYTDTAHNFVPDACGNESCACGRANPEKPEAHKDYTDQGGQHVCKCGRITELHIWGEWIKVSTEGLKTRWRHICQKCPATEEMETEDEEPPEKPVTCTAGYHIPNPTSCGCLCGGEEVKTLASFHKYVDGQCICQCGIYHRVVTGGKCPGVCKSCEVRVVASGIKAEIKMADDNDHAPCTIDDGHCGCKCGKVTSGNDSAKFHVFAPGDCRCLGADGNGGEWHRHMPASGCKGVCSVPNKWGIDGYHTVAGAEKESYRPTKATAANHTKTSSSACGCACRHYNHSNLDEWRYTANLHNSNPNDCGCFCGGAGETEIPGYHKFGGDDHCTCRCEGTHRLIKHTENLCSRVCFGANHGEGKRGDYYGYKDEAGKESHTPKGDTCGCQCGEFAASEYPETARFHAGYGEGCECECGAWHQATAGNPCAKVCNTCDKIAKSGNAADIRSATYDDHTAPADAQYCGCACGRHTTPHRHNDEECYCYATYSPNSKYTFAHGDAALIEHLNLELTGVVITNDFSCLSCGEMRTDHLREYKCDNNHFVTSAVPEHVCAIVQCRVNCECCDHTDTSPCECPFCNSVEGSSGQCTCAGRTIPRGTFKITNPVLTAEGFAELFAAIDRDEVVEIDGDDPVYEIGLAALAGKCCNMPMLETVKFNFVTNVGESAFEGAFKNCPNLKSVEFARLRIIGIGAFQYAFQECPSLKALHLPKVERIDYLSFKNCGIQEISCPSAGIIIFKAFVDSNLTTADFAAAVTVEDRAFHNCKSLSRVNLPSVSYLGPECFDGCTALKTIVLPQYNFLGSMVQTRMFAGSSLTDIYLPAMSINDWNARDEIVFDKTGETSVDFGIPSGCRLHFSDGTATVQ